MIVESFNNKAIQTDNANSPFLELFSILKRYQVLPHDGMPTLAYETEELKIMHQHVDNAMAILLQGLQDLGNLVGTVVQNQEQAQEDLKNLGLFISAIGNLTEAINCLRSDTSYSLRQRHEMDY